MAPSAFQATFSSPLPSFRPLFVTMSKAPSFRPLLEQTPEVAEATPAPPPDSAPEQEAQAQAEALLAEAQAQAAQIIAAAQQNAQVLVEQAVGEAREQERAVFAQASAELLEAIDARTRDHLEQLELQTATMVGGIVRRILNLRFEEDPSSIIPIVRQALQELTESSHVQVVVAPQHGETLREAYEELAGLLSGQARLDLIISDEAAPFGCVAHGDHGSVDARLDRRLQSIEEVVQDSIDEAKVA